MPIPVVNARLDHHPFGDFLKNLPKDEACNPHPDIITYTGCGQRWFVGFETVNAASRIARLKEMMQRAGPKIYAEMQNDSASSNSARGVIFVMTPPYNPLRQTGCEIIPFTPFSSANDFTPNALLSRLPECVRKKTRFTEPLATEIEEPEKEEPVIPGCVQMPSYD